MLRDWFSALPAYDQKAVSTLSALIEDCRRESMTGLMRLEYASTELFLWTFINGEGKQLFEYQNEKWLSVPGPQWMAKLAAPQADIRMSHIPVLGVRASEVLLSVDVEQKSSLRLSGTELLRQAQVWFEQPESGVIHIQAPDREVFGLIFGDRVANMEVLFFNGTEAIFSVEQPADLPIKETDEYQVNFYIGNKQQDIWLESRLRLAFAALTRMMIQRFGYMVGFVIADRLCARLTAVNQARSLNIKITSNGIENRHLFHSLLEASEAYSYILNNFFNEAGVLIGPRISKEIAMNMLDKLSAAQHELLADNLRELVGPQFNRASSHRE